MLINRTHISHFDIEINRDVIPCDRLVQLTGSRGNLLRFVAYLGLDRTPGSFRDYTSILTDHTGKERGQLHRLMSGNELVIDREWFESETK